MLGILLTVAAGIVTNGRGFDFTALDRGFIAYAVLIPIAAAVLVAALYAALWGGLRLQAGKSG